MIVCALNIHAKGSILVIGPINSVQSVRNGIFTYSAIYMLVRWCNYVSIQIGVVPNTNTHYRVQTLIYCKILMNIEINFEMIVSHG